MLLAAEQGQQAAVQAPTVSANQPLASTEVAPVQQAEQAVQAPPPPELPNQENGASEETEFVEYDPTQEPTQILTEEQMNEYRTRQQAHGVSEEQQAQPKQERDISEMPTMLFPNSSSSEPEQYNAQDISEMPTIQMAPPSDDAEATIAATEVPGKQGEVEAPQQAEQEQATPAAEEVTPEESSASSEATGEEEGAEVAQGATAQEEDAMEEQTTPAGEQEAAQEQENGETTFPTLPVGSLVNGRYEVTQIEDEGEQEHVYQIVDRQGYQHCWNCGSEQNAEGDEFCIDCGAGLLNAPYIMHEYPASGQAENESRVLSGTIVNTFVEQEHTYVLEQPQTEQLAFPNGVHLVAACDSDAGNLRRAEPNEDSPFILQFERIHESQSSPSGIFLVADGMGGHDNGQLASRMAVSVIAERVTRGLLLPPLTAEQDGQQPPARDEEQLVELLHGAIEDANTTLCQINKRDDTDMGCTLTGFMIVDHLAYIFNVGDSRTYMVREGTIYKLTTDHSLVGQLVAGGLIEPDEVYTHPQRNQIFRSIGDKLNVQIDIFKQQVHPGDILLSCSDGLWEMAHDPQIEEILNNAPDPQTACTQLIEAANENGGEDNISAVVVYVR